MGTEREREGARGGREREIMTIQGSQISNDVEGAVKRNIETQTEADREGESEREVYYE